MKIQRTLKNLAILLPLIMVLSTTACSEPRSNQHSIEVTQAIQDEVEKNLGSESGSAKIACISLIVLSSDQTNWWSKEANLVYAAEYMSRNAPDSMADCIRERHDAYAYDADIHDKAANIFIDALYITTSEESSAKIIAAAQDDYVDTYYIAKLAMQGNASEKSIKKALAIIKKREPQVHKNLDELFKENGVLE